jgi:ABC-2 type transport system permease protein
MNKNNKYLALARRELWEHRTLWLVPLVGAGLMVCGGLFGDLFFEDRGVSLTMNAPVPPGISYQIGSMSMLITVGILGVFAGIVTLIYLLDCLSAERKDRSILFWKSLPVSDAETVLAKLVVAVVLVPLFVLALSVVLQPLLVGITAMRAPMLRPFLGQLFGGSLSAVPNVVGFGIFALLWYLPVVAYLLLASVLARRAPIVYAVVPVVGLGLAERLTIGTHHVFNFIGERLVPWARRADDMFLFLDDSPDKIGRMTVVWSKAFLNAELWLGVLAAGVMVYAVIRLRRYRDDT